MNDDSMRARILTDSECEEIERDEPAFSVEVELRQMAGGWAVSFRPCDVFLMIPPGAVRAIATAILTYHDNRLSMSMGRTDEHDDEPN